MRILLVEDQPRVRESLARALAREGYTVDQAEEGEVALRLFESAVPDAVVLDVLMPGIDGFEVCRRVRSAGYETPVLMLTARDQVEDRVAGLDAGADDYLVKPFALEELLARLRAMLRRGTPQDARQVLRFADVILDTGVREVNRGHRSISLTRTEFSLLELFMLHPRQVLTRSQIFEWVWGYDFGANSNSLDVYISYLRRKLEQDSESRLIHTVRGVGYVLKQQ